MLTLFSSQIDRMMQDFSGDFGGSAADRSLQGNVEQQMPVLKRAQNLWQVIGRVAGFEAQGANSTDAAISAAHQSSHTGRGHGSVVGGNVGSPSLDVNTSTPRNAREANGNRSPSWRTTEGSPRLNLSEGSLQATSPPWSPLMPTVAEDSQITITEL